jgi:pimeloyl-ACP methyl ester carboxylesterase
MVDVGPYRLAAYCAGSGDPAVVFEGGTGGPHQSADYSVVVGYMKEHGFNRACWYDRAGLGKSDPGPKGTIDAENVATDLHALIRGLHIDPPYVLAGGSFGGLFVRVYRARFPHEVGGIMLIDAVQEDDPHVTLGPSRIRQGRAFLDVKKTLREVKASGSLGHLPLVVITAGQSASDPVWMEGQRALARLSDNSEHVVAEGAWHGVTDVVPALVTKLTGELVAAARHHGRFPPCGPNLRKLRGRCVG